MLYMVRKLHLRMHFISTAAFQVEPTMPANTNNLRLIYVRTFKSSRENLAATLALESTTAPLSPCLLICRWNIFSSMVPFQETIDCDHHNVRGGGGTKRAIARLM